MPDVENKGENKGATQSDQAEKDFLALHADRLALEQQRAHDKGGERYEAAERAKLAKGKFMPVSSLGVDAGVDERLDRFNDDLRRKRVGLGPVDPKRATIRDPSTLKDTYYESDESDEETRGFFGKLKGHNNPCWIDKIPLLPPWM